jgi:uncharacterized membrane protein
MEHSDLFMYAGSYADATAARGDYDQLSQLHKDDMIGKYQAAVFEKRADGKVKVIDTVSTTRSTGAKWGAGIGAALGLVFPPAILVGAAEGAAVGALAGNISKGWFKGDIKRLADELEPGQAGVIAVAEAGESLDADAVMTRSQRSQKEHITGEDAETIRQQLRTGETVGAKH